MSSPEDKASTPKGIAKTAEQDGLLFGCVPDGKGGAQQIGWDDLSGPRSAPSRYWIHLDRSSVRAQAWLREESGITPVTADALLAEETRPRVFRGKRGYVAILRGVNTNPGQDPQDMVAIRIWCDGKRLVTLRQRKLLTPRDVLELLDQGIGPHSIPAIFEHLISRLIERMGSVITDYDDALDGIEQQVETAKSSDLRRKLSELRRQIISLRRYMAPQREALNQILTNFPDWLDDRQRLGLREAADRLQRYVEDLDAARERSVVMIDEIATRLAESMNRNMYIFSLVALLFLPLSFFTGLLGINVGGMPGVENSSAFWITSGLIAIILVGEVVVLRKLKII